MKLSKNDLSFALNCTNQYYCDSLNSDYPNKDDQKNAELFRDLEQEADNDTLEIEGYHRTVWIKFNPNDPKTFPPVGDFIFFQGCEEGYGYIGTGNRNEEDTDEAFASRAIYPYLTHWLPLPQPPVEKE